MVAGLGFGGPRELVPILMESGEVDGVILISIGWYYSMTDAVNRPTDFSHITDDNVLKQVERDTKYLDIMADYTQRWNKPLLLHCSVARLAVRRNYPGLVKLLDQGIMLYPSLEDAVKVMSALAERRRFLARDKEEGEGGKEGRADETSPPPERGPLP
jgi:hypothetical protein